MVFPRPGELLDEAVAVDRDQKMPIIRQETIHRRQGEHIDEAVVVDQVWNNMPRRMQMQTIPFQQLCKNWALPLHPMTNQLTTMVP
jgi:hypothetical protein